jgi:hypothetical protein
LTPALAASVSAPAATQGADLGFAPGAAYLRLAGIRKEFGAFTALSHIDLDIAKGEFVCFLGPVGLWQDHAAAHHRWLGGAVRRTNRARRA